MAETNKHILLLPAVQTDTVYQDFVLYAIQNKMTLNTGYFARGDFKAIEAHADKAWENLQAGVADNQTMFVFWQPDWKTLAKEKLTGKTILCDVDGYVVVLSTENDLAAAPIDLQLYCSVPLNSP